MGSSILFLVLALAGFVSAGMHDVYTGYSVHGVIIKSFKDQKKLHELESVFDLDILKYGAEDRDAVVMVSPDNSARFLDELDRNNIQHYLKIGNVPRELEEFDKEVERHLRTRSENQAKPFDYYPRYAEVDAYMERIAAEYPNLVTLVNAGNSFEGRAIKYLKISTTNFTDSTKPVYFMEAMLHAREWVTTPVTLYSVYRLVEDLREGDRDLLEGTDWIILPIANPDGYEYTFTDFRMWRKTRSVNPDVSETCVGVDPNRNFDVHFNTTGVSNNPCHDTYPGTSAFSEVETSYVRDILIEHLDRIQVFLDIHSHGNWILFGFDNMTIPANGMQLHHVGAIMGAAIDAVKLPEADYYKVGNSAFLLYGTSGSAQDYAQDIGVPFSYTLELPGYSYAFQVPPSYIAQMNEETWLGIAAQVRLAKLHYNVRIGL